MVYTRVVHRVLYTLGGVYLPGMPPYVPRWCIPPWYASLLYYPGYTPYIPLPYMLPVYIPVPGPVVGDEALGSTLEIIRENEAHTGSLSSNV